MWGALFPGQGSQHQGMGRHFFENFALARHLFEEASDTLHVDFKKLCFEGSEADLALTENTQPALLLVSTVAYRVFAEESGARLPTSAAGHSVGEYAALVAAGAMPFTAALRAVRTRGEAMQAAVPVGQGGMLAVMGLEPHQVEFLCRWAEEKAGAGPLEPANFNAPGQIVVSGHQAVINWLKDGFSKDIFEPAPSRARLIPLKVSAPFHCSLMRPAEEKMAEVLHEVEFGAPHFPVVQNFTAAAEFDPDSLRRNLISQVTGPVRWVECVEQMMTLGEPEGTTTMVEFGPGQVLAGLAKKIRPEITVLGLNSLNELRTAVAAIAKT